MVDKKWGLGSDQFKKQRDSSKHQESQPSDPVRAVTGDADSTTGRVRWNSQEIDYALIKPSDTNRAIFRLQKQLPEFIWETAAYENNPLTLPEVRTLLDGVSVAGHKLEDANQVLA